MNIVGILIAAAIVGGTGLFIGVFLGIAGEKLAVEVDEREEAISAVLPGNNCGGCGYAGCSGLATAIVAGNAEVGACPVGGALVASKIATIMGQEAGESVAMTAFVKCGGTCEKAKENYTYYGVQDCAMATIMQNGGSKACAHGCLGFGNCSKACPFDAIEIVNGVAVVEETVCKACGKCVSTCPLQLIEMIPAIQKTRVLCSSNDKGKEVITACTVGCIGCKMCQKVCEYDAITVENNIAHIDSSKCTNCGKCVEKCPRKSIIK